MRFIVEGVERDRQKGSRKGKEERGFFIFI